MDGKWRDTMPRTGVGRADGGGVKGGIGGGGGIGIFGGVGGQDSFDSDAIQGLTQAGFKVTDASGPDGTFRNFLEFETQTRGAPNGGGQGG